MLSLTPGAVTSFSLCFQQEAGHNLKKLFLTRIIRKGGLSLSRNNFKRKLSYINILWAKTHDEFIYKHFYDFLSKLQFISWLIFYQIEIITRFHWLGSLLEDSKDQIFFNFMSLRRIKKPGFIMTFSLHTYTQSQSRIQDKGAFENILCTQVPLVYRNYMSFPYSKLFIQRETQHLKTQIPVTLQFHYDAGHHVWLFIRPSVIINRNENCPSKRLLSTAIFSRTWDLRRAPCQWEARKLWSIHIRNLSASLINSWKRWKLLYSRDLPVPNRPGISAPPWENCILEPESTEILQLSTTTSRAQSMFF